MTLNKAWTLILIGILLLTGIFGSLLAFVRADGTAYALVMVGVLSIGGVANYFAVERYGSHRRPPVNRSSRAPSSNG